MSDSQNMNPENYESNDQIKKAVRIGFTRISIRRRGFFTVNFVGNRPYYRNNHSISLHIRSAPAEPVFI